MTELATLGLSIRSDGVVVATDRLKDFEGAGRKAEGVAGSLMRVAGAMGLALAGAFSTQVLGQYADAWSDMQSRVGAAIKNMEAAPAMMMRITDIANASYSPLQQTNDVYGRNVTTLGALGRSAVEAADFTEALNHALVTTATKGQDADVVINALSRSISNNKMRTMEFETIMSRSPRVLEAIAAEMDTNIIGLRRLAEQGKVTGTIIVDALINSLEELRDEAGQMPATLSDARMIFTNVFTEWVGRIDQAWNASGRLAEQTIELAMAFRGTADTVIRLGHIVGSIVGPAFDLLASHMDTLASVAGIAVAAVAGFYAPAMLSGLASLTWAIGTGLVGAIKAVTLAMLANPIGVFVGALAVGVTAAFMFRDQIKEAIGVDVVGVVKGAANSVIGFFDVAFNDVKAIWSGLPAAIGDAAISTANSVITNVRFMLRSVQVEFNKFLGGLDQMLQGAGLPVLGVRINPIKVNDPSALLENPYQGAQGALDMQLRLNRAFASGRDYLGEMGGAFSAMWTNAEGAGGAISDLMNSLGGNGDGMGGLGGTGKLNAYQEATKSVLENIQALNQQALSFGLSETAATRFSTAMDLLRAAEEAKIPVTSQLIDEINRYADATAIAADRVREMEQQAQLAISINNTLASGFSNMFSGIIDGSKSAGEAIGDLLAQLGQLLINQAFTMLFGGGTAGGIGGMLAPIFSPLPSFSYGGAGIVGGSGTYVPGAPDNTLFVARVQRGEPYAFGREAIAGIGGGSNDNGGGGDIIINNSIHVAPGTSPDTAPAIAREVSKELRKQLPDAIRGYNQNPYRRFAG